MTPPPPAPRTGRRPVVFLLPGTGSEWWSGGTLTSKRMVEVLEPVADVGLETYRELGEGLTARLASVTPADDPTMYVAGFGPDLRELEDRLRGRRLVHWANTFGWGHVPGPDVPILSASRFTMGLWGEQAPANFAALLPNPVMDEFHAHGEHPRDVDVLYVERKSGRYLREVLLPALPPHMNVVAVDEHIGDLAALFRRAKVYVYDSRDYWRDQRRTEGFGLQPVEALACGCTVFSSVNAGLSDLIDPGFVGQKIGCRSTAYDVARITRAVETWTNHGPTVDPVGPYRADAIRRRWAALEHELEEFFSYSRTEANAVYDDHGPLSFGPTPDSNGGQMVSKLRRALRRARSGRGR